MFWLNFQGTFNTHVLPFLSWSTSCREAASLRSQVLPLKISTSQALKKRRWDKKQSRHVYFKSCWLVKVHSASRPFHFYSTYPSLDLDTFFLKLKTKLTEFIVSQVNLKDELWPPTPDFLGLSPEEGGGGKEEKVLECWHSHQAALQVCHWLRVTCEWAGTGKMDVASPL